MNSSETIESAFNQAQQLHQQGRLKEAEKCYLDILGRVPEQPDVIHHLGLLNVHKGDYTKAERYFIRSLKLVPDNPLFHLNYGLLQTHQKKIKKAIHSYKKAIELNPDYPEAWFNLGVCYGETGDYEHAEESYRKAINIKSDYIKAIFNLAIVQEMKGDIDAATRTLNLIENMQSDSPEILYVLGQALHRIGSIEHSNRAMEYLQRVEALNPDSVDVKLAIAKILEERNKVDDALRIFRSILDLEPDHYDARKKYALCLIGHNDIQASKNILEKLNKTNPDDLDVLVGLAEIENYSGDFRHAEKKYQQILAKDKNNVFAIYGLSRCRKFREEDRKQAEKFKSIADKINRSRAYFAVAKIYDDLGEYDTAFQYYQKANERRNRHLAFDPEQHAELTEKIISVYADDKVKKLQLSGNPSHNPLFVLGAPRSGTSLVEQVLSSHSKVDAAGEISLIGDIADNKLEDLDGMARYPDNLFQMDEKYIQRWSTWYLDETGKYKTEDTVEHITNKMPDNFYFIGLIICLFPEARILHCVRNPVDTCLSIYFQNFTSEHEYAFDLKNIVAWYKDYRKLMDYWQSIFPVNIIDITYEDMVDNIENSAKKIIEFCRLDWEPSCVEFHKSKRAVFTASNWQVKQPVYRSSRERWRNYEAHLSELINDLSEYLD